MKRTHIQVKVGESIPQTYILEDTNPTVSWNSSSISFKYEEGQGIKIDVYANDKEMIDALVNHFITPRLCTLSMYYYYGRMWKGTLEGLLNGDFHETGSFIVQK